MRQHIALTSVAQTILALTILLISLKGTIPEIDGQDSALVTSAIPLSSPLETALGKTDRGFAPAAPVPESSDAAHAQSEDAVAPPQSPAPAITNAAESAAADAAGEIANSLDGLCNALMTSAQDNDLPVPFFANLIWQESGLRHDAVSPVGALGIAQFMPSVAIEEGVGDPFDPRQAIPASARLLRALRQHFGNLGFVAAAYNAGAHRVGEWLDHHRALPRETRNYVVRVTGRTIEAWRKSPLDDSRLTFARPLPCRKLPAFADLEQALLRQARQRSETVQIRLDTGKKARNYHGGGHEAAHRQRPAHEKRRIA